VDTKELIDKKAILASTLGGWLHPVQRRRQEQARIADGG
jgi:hypothetical protein